MKGDEAVYTIPLRDAFHVPVTKRASKAVKIVKEFLVRHTKAAEVKLDSSINEALWNRGIKKPPRSVKVKVVKEDNIVKASLAE